MSVYGLVSILSGGCGTNERTEMELRTIICTSTSISIIAEEREIFFQTSGRSKCLLIAM